ncbi:MAG: YbaN family protein [Gemmatimonadales bacterium]|jgi:uncharacterized membrane protein YbaN (DUF454 family)
MTTDNKPARHPSKVLLMVLGTLSLALGVLGMLVPLLPTTPFLLLAAACYARSSKRLHRWLLTNRWFGEYIANYHAGRGISLKQKVITILLLWVTIGITTWLALSRWWARAILIGIATAVTVFLLTRKTYRPETAADQPSGDAG